MVPPELIQQLERPVDDRIELWPDMVPAVSLFFAMETQWRWVGAGMAGAFRVGLDYAALPAVAGVIQVEMTPRVLADLRTLERAATAEWGRKAKR